MAGPCYINQDDLELRFGARRILDVFSNDGRTIGPNLVVSCKVASRKIESLLSTGWSYDKIQTIIQDDEAIWALACDLAMADGIATNRPEWNAVENPPYAKLDKQARELLASYGSGDLDTRATEKVGENPHTRVGKVRTRKILFAPTKDSPQRGGY